MTTLQLHGPPQVMLASGASLPLSAREAALLVWLHLEGPTPRARLAGQLWPGGDDAKARANLRQTLLRLRRAAGELLTEEAGVLQLAADVIVAAPGSAPGADRLLGPIEFDDAPELAEWLQARRDAVARELQRSRLTLARQSLDAGELDTAMAAADAVLAADAAVEEAHRLRMEVLLQRGDRAAAVAAWDECRHALRRAFGIAPGALTQQLGRSILAAEAVALPSAPAPRQLPAALRRPPQLAGRDTELQALLQALAQGQPALVVGPGGAGKSRLMADAAQALQPALLTGARPGDATLPGALAARLLAAAVEQFHPVLDAATRADIQHLLPGGPEPAEALRSALEHRRVLAAVARTMLACHARGMRLVLVDDLQYADELSLDAIGVVMGGWLAAPPERSATAVFGLRADELRPAAARLVSLLERSGRALRLELAPLPAAGVRQLLDGLPWAELARPQPMPLDALAQALHARVGGTPAFVLEALKALWPEELQRWQPGDALPVPATLLESVRQRLQRLSPEALQLAQLAAVAQGDATLALAASAFGRAPLAMAPLYAELEAAQVLDATGFSHDLVAEAVERSLPVPLRAPLHRLVAEHLQAQQGPPASIAAHLQAAGEPAAAARWHLQAGHRAKARWQLAEAAASFEAALAGLAGERDRSAVIEAASEAARACLFLGRKDDAARLLAQAEPLARHASERARLATLRTITLINQQRLTEAQASAQRLAEDLLNAAEQLDADALGAGLRAQALARALVGEGEPALALLEQLAPRLAGASPRQQASLNQTRGALLCRLNRAAEALPALQAALAAAQQASDPVLQANAGEELMRALIALGRSRQALVVGEQALALIVDHGFGAGFVVDTRTQMALVLAALGRPAEALAEREAALQELQRAGALLADGLINTHRVLLASCGQIEAALALPLRTVQSETGPPDVWGRYQARSMAHLALAQGQDPRPWLAEAWRLGDDSLAVVLAQAAASAPATRECAQAWLDRALAEGGAVQIAMARRELARACLAEGDRAVAVAQVQASLEPADAIEPWAEPTPLRWCRAAEILLACGEPAAAAQVLQEGARWVRQAAEGLDEAGRAAWCQGHVLHRHLLAHPLSMN